MSEPALTVQQSQSTPRPERRVRWVWRYEKVGYGVLLVSTKTDNGWHRQEYFARPLKGRMGRVWELSEMIDNVGLGREFVVNLVAFSCTCDDFLRDNDCPHLRCVASLDHHGQL